ncbi:MAG: cation-translocating P-type ATPase, partial [Chloroflexota bacterium]|nr:cation-translocating P-type ATPase [Chloroflexota bacterium]
AIHVPIAGLALIPVLLGSPLILLPVHVVFLEFVIDPASSVAFEAEPEEDDVMLRPPRDWRERVFNLQTVTLSSLQGLSGLAIVSGLYFWALRSGPSADQALALAFATLVLVNLGLIIANRSYTRSLLASFTIRNASLWWILGAALVALAASLYVPWLRLVFSFGALPWSLALLALGVGVLAIGWFEAVERVTLWAFARQRRLSASKTARE